MTRQRHRAMPAARAALERCYRWADGVDVAELSRLTRTMRAQRAEILTWHVTRGCSNGPPPRPSTCSSRRSSASGMAFATSPTTGYGCCCTAASPGRPTAPQDCQAAPPVSWRRALILYLDYCGFSIFARYVVLELLFTKARFRGSGRGSVAAVRPAREPVEVLPAEDGRRRRSPAGPALRV